QISISSPSVDPMDAAAALPGELPLTGGLSTQNPAQPSIGIVRLRDVATVEAGAQNYNQTCLYEGKPSGGLMVFTVPGTNALEVADAVRAKMEELRARFPDGLDYTIAYDTTPFIRESVSDVTRALLQAVALVALV